MRKSGHIHRHLGSGTGQKAATMKTGYHTQGNVRALQELFVNATFQPTRSSPLSALTRAAFFSCHEWMLHSKSLSVNVLRTRFLGNLETIFLMMVFLSSECAEC